MIVSIEKRNHLKNIPAPECTKFSSTSIDLYIELMSVEASVFSAITIQGRRARKGDLVTRITVTLSIFIFSTCFLVQNCRESQGASF
mgnify:FL=1